ncbi:MAG: transcriptional repressor [Rhizobiales bacterium]|nr:transcriptional repressor [Hyphomicrobiales bacterium]
MASHDHTHAHGCGHDHAAALPRLLLEAEDLCRARGVRLTDQRRAVFTALVRHGHPLGAYDLIEKLRPKSGRSPAPIAIYRALDFLQQNGLIHRLETLNAYIACPHTHGAGEAVVFLICEECSHVEEASTSGVNMALDSLATQHGFVARRRVVELGGLCRACQSRRPARSEVHTP